MYKPKLSLLLTVIFIFSFLFYSCKKNKEDDIREVNSQKQIEQDNIATALYLHEQCDSFYLALSRTALLSSLKAKGNYTVFAASNKAFESYIAADSSLRRIADIPYSHLTAILSYHLLNSLMSPNEIQKSTYFPSLNTQAPNGEAVSMHFSKQQDNYIINQSSNINISTLEASNGNIYLIDKLLKAPNVAILLSGNPDFDSLNVLISQSKAAAKIITSAHNFTLFAPNNQAFIDLLDSNNTWNKIADINPSSVEKMLQSHIVLDDNLRAKAFSPDRELNNMNNKSITLHLDNGPGLISSAKNQSKIKITTVDIQGTNGVIHQIDQIIQDQ